MNVCPDHKNRNHFEFYTGKFFLAEFEEYCILILMRRKVFFLASTNTVIVSFKNAMVVWNLPN